jgi:hypothetical protein
MLLRDFVYGLKEGSEDLLDKPTPTVDNLAEKYHTSLIHIKMQLRKGIKVEMEHTSHPKVAKEIALDHLGEDLFYYDNLNKAEKGVAETNTPRSKNPLTYRDPVEKWIAVFKRSTHKKFAGKTPKERENMARMAQYRAVQNKKPY